MPSDREVTPTQGSDTLDALRDELAGLCGWRRVDVPCPLCGKGCKKHDPHYWDNGASNPFINEHPFPPGDFTALAGAWPEDERLCVDYSPPGKMIPTGEPIPAWWYAFVQGQYGCHDEAMGRTQFDPPGFPTEYEARLRLTCAVLRAATRSPRDVV